MIFQHKFFQLNADTRSVMDENGRELRLTGNAYRVLAFLCKHGHANITQIGDFLDHAKDFGENHIRQYKYKINTIVGHDVIEYRNGLYALLGLVEKNESVLQYPRNTSLLPPSEPQLNKSEALPVTQPSMTTENPSNPQRPWYKKWIIWTVATAIVAIAVSSPFVWNWYTTRISPSTPQATRVACPPEKPIKGNAQSGIYHVPEGQYYNQTRPERCFATEEEAQRAGYRKSSY